MFAKHSLTPNLFIIGSAKSGTSALHAYLSLHPEIRMGDEKEPCFFVEQSQLKQIWAVMAHRPVSHDWIAYLNNFAGGEESRYRGEASVFYSMAPIVGGVPERIAAVSPQARLIYMVREPVKRTIGHYWQEAKEFHEHRPLAEAIRANPIYRDTSDYAMQIDHYLRVFDRSQIHVVIAEDLRGRRQETLAEVFDWLGVAPFEPTADQLRDRHVSPASSRRARFPGVAAVRDSALWAGLRERLPTGVVATLRGAGTRTFDKAEVADAEIRAELTSYFAPRTRRLEAMIAKPIPQWQIAAPTI